MKTLLDACDLSVEELDDLIELGNDIMNQPEKYQDICNHKILATLFFEPSTRTRLSFESAMLSLGGKCLGFPNANVSSISKGESVTDTIWTVSQYCDIIAMRHPKEGAPYAAIKRSDVPLINAGDGGHNHPTQTLTDILTIVRELGHLDNTTIGFCGDLKYGRTVHSLLKVLARYENMHFVFISPKELEIPEYLKEDILSNENISYKEVRTIEECINELDILYMTRIQKERFDDEYEYNRLKDSYVLDAKKMKLAKDNMIVLHPLPRVNEISTDVDDDPRAKYFSQVKCGRYIRMALILKLLGLDKRVERLESNLKKHKGVLDYSAPKMIFTGNYQCIHNACITNADDTVEPKFTINSKQEVRCYYCESRVKYE